MTPQVIVAPHEYLDAARFTAAVYDQSCAALGIAVSALTATSGMAGDDTAGRRWADAYDIASSITAFVLADATTGLGSLSDRLHASGVNLINAESSSTLGATPSSIEGVVHAAVDAPLVPSAHGAALREPFGWSLIAPVIGWIWPDGDPAALRTGASAWTVVADRVDALAASVGPIAALMSSQVAPEIPDVLVEFDSMRTLLSDTAEQGRAVAATCIDYADALDRAHRQIIAALASLADLMNPGSILGAVLDVVTGDLDEAQERIREVAHDVAAIIAALVAVANRVAGDLTSVADTLTALGKVAGTYLGREIYNVTADMVNAAATFGATVLAHPEDTVAIVGGAMTIAAGVGGEIGGVALDATGIGAIAGVPVNVASAGLIATGAAAIGAGTIDLGRHAAEQPRVTVMEARTVGGEPLPRTSAPDGSMLGRNGTQTNGSKTVGRSSPNKPYWRIDVENPAPGSRPGQMHLQDRQGNKYYYNFNTGEFEGAPSSVISKFMKDPALVASIQKAEMALLGTR